MKWYNKFDIVTRRGSLNCPNCNHFFEERIIYFPEPNDCPSCNHSIGFICISPYQKHIYTIDLNNSPNILKVLFDYTKSMNQKESYNELKELILMITDPVSKDDF